VLLTPPAAGADTACLEIETLGEDGTLVLPRAALEVKLPTALERGVAAAVPRVCLEGEALRGVDAVGVGLALFSAPAPAAPALSRGPSCGRGLCSGRRGVLAGEGDLTAEDGALAEEEHRRPCSICGGCP